MDRIEKLLQSKKETTKLELKDLNEVSPRIGELTSLTSLAFFSCDMESLPPEIENLQKLETLDITFCKNLLQIPDFIFRLKNLKHLTFAWGSIVDIPIEIKNLQNLETLDIHDNKLTKLPTELFQLKKLQELSISNNPIHSIPKEIGELTFLNKLYMYECELTDVPNELSNCIHLERILAKENKIQSLPKDIGNLQELEWFDFSQNEVANLPNSIGKCVKLESINLYQNQVQSIPSEIGNCISLKNLSLSRNQITTIPEELLKLEELDVLELSRNQLTELPNCFEEGSKLRKLSLGHNQLKALPESLKYLPLTGADFEHNPFEDELHVIMSFYDMHNCFLQGIKLFKLLDGHGYRKYYAAVKATEPDKRFVESFYHILNESEGREIIPIEDLIVALQIKFMPLQNKALLYIQKHYGPKLINEPISSNSELVILGNISFKKTEAKERLVEKGVKVVTKIKKTTTHVVLGKGIKKYDNFDQEGLTFLTDYELNDFFEKHEDTYVKDDIDMQENMQNMLLSKSEENVQLALEMLKTGGVPKEYITILFCICKNTNFSQKTRKAAKSFLEIHTDDALKKLVTSRTIIFTNNYIDAQKLYRNLRSYSHKDIDNKVLVKYIIDWTRKGYMFWFAQLEEQELDETVNQLLIDNPDFLLSEANFYYAKRDLMDFPNASRIRFTVTYQKDLPEKLRNFKQLTYLDLSDTGYKRLPDWLIELDKLKTIHLGSSRIKEFPTVLEQMEQLEELHIYGATFADKVENIPDCFDTTKFPYNLTRIV